MRLSTYLVFALLAICASFPIAYANTSPSGGFSLVPHTSNPYAGSYEGVVSLNAGPDAPVVSTITLTIGQDGTVTGGIPEGLGTSVIEPFNASVTSDGVLTITQTGIELGTLQLVLDPVSHVLAGTTINALLGTNISLWLLPVPEAPLSVTGVYIRACDIHEEIVDSMSISIASSAAVSATLAGTLDGQIFNISAFGYSDVNGNVVLAYNLGNTPSIAIGTAQLNASSLIYAASEHVNGQVDGATLAASLPAGAPPFVGHTFPAGLAMMSVPTDYTGMPLSSVLGYNSPVLAVWQPLADMYSVTPVPPADELVAGQGYWVRFPQQVTITIAGSAPQVPFDIPLSVGWNMIGCPQAASTSLSSLTVIDPLNAAQHVSQIRHRGDMCKTRCTRSRQATRITRR